MYTAEATGAIKSPRYVGCGFNDMSRAETRCNHSGVPVGPLASGPVAPVAPRAALGGGGGHVGKGFL